MIYLSQRDPRWSQLSLGASSLKVGRYGCTTTCISMLSDYFGCYMNPGQIASHIDWFTKDGLILWTMLSFQTMKFRLRIQGRDDTAIKEALRNPSTAVMLQVDNGQHWIVAKRKTFFGNDYVCQDPWTGKECVATRQYKNITGCAIFARK